jgi:hypothetical protein
MNPFHLQTQELYPKDNIDVEVSSGEDDVARLDASVDKLKKSVGDDAEDGGVSLVEPIAPNPISSSMPEQSDPSTIVWVTAPILPSGKHGLKHPPPTVRRNKPLDQVMTQIEFPPYRRPHSPLDLVVIQNIFGCLFEVFQHISQAAVAGASTDDSTRPQKKMN